MIEVVIEMRNEAIRFGVVVRARSVREAARIAATVYPLADIRVRFPIDPEVFFVENPTARQGIVGYERREERAA